MTKNFKYYLQCASSGSPLSSDEMADAILQILEGSATPVQIASFLTALKMRGETAEEIAAAARVMRSKSVRFQGPENAIDCCGTGGDGTNSYNISTAVTFVLSGCGLPVAKHGNKAVSSMTGAADILVQMGVNIQAEMDVSKTCLQDIGLCFLFAQRHHPAMKQVGPVRVDMGFRTIFNILGPLTNPAGAKYQLLGIFDRAMTHTMATALKALGTTSAWVVHGSDGLDELTLTGPSYVSALAPDGCITTFTVTPEEAGLPRCVPAQLTGGDPQYNAAALISLLDGTVGPYRDIVLFNTAAALIVAGKAVNLKDGVAQAARSIDSGAAKAKLDALVRTTNQ